MSIQFTEAAQTAIGKILGGQGYIKLAYDSEGCGCSVSGVPTLWLVDEPAAFDLVKRGEPFDVLMEQKHEVFFEDAMKVDYQEIGHIYSLKSSSQIYNGRMQLIDKRRQPAGLKPE
ncbi:MULTISPECIES: iron-sulfur cluster biosynthesis family protein [Paenibacillus]|uniref:iron-sulfur cluster biosynthesis family protein n=1 Tax=Paenibacillus TaxID=44249 RepID=UPI0022B913BB|nr:iron-sulfur cluster biosynthesis family protein [Paenibacillus caseinilyticus]MCZ8521452.1 hypothetical protein [Paenibacillus caseinilyticus]